MVHPFMFSCLCYSCVSVAQSSIFLLLRSPPDVPPRVLPIAMVRHRASEYGPDTTTRLHRTNTFLFLRVVFPRRIPRRVEALNPGCKRISPAPPPVTILIASLDEERSLDTRDTPDESIP